MDIIIYTDGACKGNPGPGGWGVVLQYGEHVKELSGAASMTTNNRMEMTAIIEALKALKTHDKPVRVHSDSSLCVNGVNNWMHDWAKNGWLKSNRKLVENVDLWKEIYALCHLFSDIKFIKVPAHSGIELNERADQLANIGVTQNV